MWRNWLEIYRTCNLRADRPMDSISKWLIIVRCCVFPMTMISAAIGGLLAASVGRFEPLPFALAAVGLLLAHAANNMINDYFDLETGLDTAEYARAQYAPHPVLSGMVTREQLRRAILLVNALDGLIALALTAMRGWPILAFALAGLFISVQRRIPAVHPHILRPKTPLPSFPQHLLKVLVFGLPALGLVIHPKVAGKEGLPLRPEQGQKRDPFDHPPMLATPMIGHPIHLLGIRLVQRRIIQDQKPLPHVHEGLRLLPQRLRVGRLSLKQAGEGIVGGGPLLFRRTSGRLRAGENLLGRDQEVNVVQVITLGWIHWLISVFYVAPPLRLKRIGLGELGVFLVWGPLMIGGTFYATTGTLPGWVWLASIPYALLVSTVLIGKHIDKLEQDRARGIYTLPVLLGERMARALNAGLMVAFYVVVGGLALAGVLGPWVWLTALSLPRLIDVLRTYARPRPAEPPPGYPVWPLWYVSWAFVFNRRAGALFLAGLLLNLILPLRLPVG
jgi:1,4-dihydroxy-2-naphthoate octaprenyltransferase